MKWIVPILVTLLLSVKTNAQCDSVFFRYAGTSINSVALIDTSKIFAVGDYGYVIKTIDAGKSWRNIKTFCPYTLKSIQFITDSIGYTVGGWRTILKTEDQGESWFSLFADIKGGFSNITAPFNDLYFFNKDRGYIVGDYGVIISTKDGGRTWQNTSINEPKNLNSITFISDSIGFTCGVEGILYKTENGGRTWQKITIAGNSLPTLNKIRFINTTTGFILANNLYLKTTDAGVTWTRVNSTGTLHDIGFIDALRGFMVGTYTNTSILKTEDGGNTWTTNYNYPATHASYYCVATDPGRKKVVMAGGGEYNEFIGYNGRNIISTSDAGINYTSLSRNGKVLYRDLFSLNDSTCYVTGDMGITLKTADYGESWKTLEAIPFVSSSGGSASKIFFLDSLHGYGATDKIYKTADGGKTWNPTTVPDGGLQFLCQQMYFFNTLKGLVQDGARIYKTINGGSNWEKVVTSGSFYRDFTVKPDGKVFAVGYGGKIDISPDEGTTWAPFDLNTTKYLTCVYFYNNSTGFIGTADTAIFKTTDGGNTWTKINTGIWGLQVRSFYFFNSSVGYMMCNTSFSSSIYKTTDGGLTWSFVRQESQDLTGFSGFKTLYIAGSGGIILKTDTLQKPGIPGYIAGYNMTCINTKTGFSTGNMAGVNFNWVLQDGGINFPLANKDTVLWNTFGQHTISVSASNVCGVSPSRQTSCYVTSFEPAITVMDSVFTATEGLSYQWYLNGSSTGAVSRSIIPHIAGTYTVTVESLYGCSATTPGAIYAGLPATLCPGGNTSIPSSLPSASYQWQRDDGTGTGFVNISDNSFYTGTHLSLLQLKNISSSWYGYKFRCVTNSGPSDIYALQFINYWNGAVSQLWENPANWSCGVVPDANTDVVINSGTIFINTDVTIRKLTINPEASLTVLGGKKLVITH